jgi:GDP-L-fucose synthase
MTTLITGGSGMVGKFLKELKFEGIYLSSKDCDLTSQQQVDKLFKDIKPTKVIHLAARVGGITENLKYPVQFLEENVLMNTFLLQNCVKYSVEDCLSVLSTCIYPDIVANYPMNEDMLFEGPPAKSNFSYAYAKRTLAVQIDSINKQYNKKYNYLIPCNLYGEYDKFDENSHYVSSLIRKIHEANKNKKQNIEIYGDGTPIRQFMHAKDLAYIIKIFLDNNITENCNVSNNEIYNIKEIAEIALKSTNNQNLQIIFDTTKPNGQHRKDVTNKKLLNIIGNYNFINLFDGIRKVYEYYDKTCK